MALMCMVLSSEDFLSAAVEAGGLLEGRRFTSPARHSVNLSAAVERLHAGWTPRGTLTDSNGNTWVTLVAPDGGGVEQVEVLPPASSDVFDVTADVYTSFGTGTPRVAADTVRMKVPRKGFKGDVAALGLLARLRPNTGITQRKWAAVSFHCTEWRCLFVF